MKKNIIALIFISVLGCTSQKALKTPNASNPIPLAPIGTVSKNYLIRSRAVFDLNLGGQTNSATPTPRGILQLINAANADGTSPIDSGDITITNQPQILFQIDKSQQQIVATATNNALTNFLQVNVSQLIDNDLSICRASELKCDQALIRVYTTGQNGPGLWNDQTKQSIPLIVNTNDTGTQVVGLSDANAVTLQTYDIDPSTVTINLADFTDPQYNFNADFTFAGAGVFNTRVVFEYVLSFEGLIENGCLATNLPFGGGTGTIADPFKICSPQHIQSMSNADPASNFLMYTDVDMAGYDMDQYRTSKNGGTFDGNHKTIKNLKSISTAQPTYNYSPPSPDFAGPYGGLFDYISGTTIKDLTVEVNQIYSGPFSITGGVVGEIGAGSTVDNVTVSFAQGSYIDGYNYNGGLAGGIDGGAVLSNSTVLGYYDSNTLSRNDFGDIRCHIPPGATTANAPVALGGVLGYLGSGVVTNVSFVGTVNCPSGVLIGGISGFSGSDDGGSDTPNGTLTLASVSNAQLTGLGQIGGAIGYSNTGVNVSQATIDSVLLSEGSSTVGTLGGIIGGIDAYSNTSLFSQININNLSISSPVANNIGGIFGYAKGNSTLTNASVSNSQITGLNSVGGVVGYLSSSALIQNVTSNMLTIIGYGGTGGIIGGMGDSSSVSNVSITNSSVTGNGQAGGGGIGGAIGGTTTTGSITNLTLDTDMITGLLISQNIGGAIGVVSSSPTVSHIVVKNSTILGYQAVGGVFGNVGNSPTIDTITSKNNIITAVRGDVGGILGSIWQQTVFAHPILTNLEVDSDQIVESGTDGQSGGISGYVAGLSSFSNATVTNSKISGYFGVGGLTGTLVDQAIFSHSSVDSLTTVTSGVNGVCGVGGFVGNLISGTIYQSSTGADVSCSSSFNVGGMVGIYFASGVTLPALIQESYSTAFFSGNARNAGGFIGGLGNTSTNNAVLAIIDSYSLANVSGQFVNGLVGSFYSNGQSSTLLSVTNSFQYGLVNDSENGNNYSCLLPNQDFQNTSLSGVFYNSDNCSSTSTLDLSDGLTNAQFADESNFVNYDFTSSSPKWKMGPTHPILNWQN